MYFIFKNTKDKENLLVLMEEGTEDTIQQLYESIGEKEQHIKSLQDLLTSERFNSSVLQHTLSLRDSEITELKNEITLSKMKEQQCTEELKMNHEKDICKQLENLRVELEKCHRKEIAETKQIYEEEMILKYKNDLEQLKKELSALNSEEHNQNLNSIIIGLNNSLHESEIHKENLRKKLENRQEKFQRQKTEIEVQYKILIDVFKSLLSEAEEQVKEAQQYKQEKQHLNEEIQELDSCIHGLHKKPLFEAENSADARQVYNEEIVSNKNLMILKEKHTLPDASLSAALVLEEITNKPCQFKGEEEFVPEELEFQCELGVDSSRGESKEIMSSRIEESEGNEGDYLSEEQLSEPAFFTVDEDMLAKYLVSTERPEQSYLSGGSEGYAIEEDRCSRYGSDSNVLLESSMDFKPPLFNFGLDEKTCHCSLAPETFEKTEVEVEDFISFLSDGSLQQNKISNCDVVKDDERASHICLLNQLTEQLHEKESALEKSQWETQEAAGKWKKVIAELSLLHVELNKEREARVCCEKQLLQKTEKEKELENKISLLIKQQGENGGQPYHAVEPLTQKSESSTWQQMLKDLQEEREMLMVQLRTQEQLVKEVQEQKTASDSVTSEVQSLFGRQLAVLQSQRDQMQTQLDAQKAKNLTITELLGQKAVLEETLLKEQDLLKAEISNKEQNLALLLKEKTVLCKRLSSMEKDLIKAENDLAANASIVADLEKNIRELNTEVQNLKEVQKCERLGYEDKLNLNNAEINKLNAEIEAKSTEYNVKESQLIEEITHLKKVQLELENRLQESFQSAQAVQEAQSEMVKHYKEEIGKMESQHLVELTKVSFTHKKEVGNTNNGSFWVSEYLEYSLQMFLSLFSDRRIK